MMRTDRHVGPGVAPSDDGPVVVERGDEVVSVHGDHLGASRALGELQLPAGAAPEAHDLAVQAV